MELNRYAKDLIDDPVTKWVSDRFAWWVALGLLIPTVLGGLLTMSWTGALLGLIWGGLVRVFLVHHVTWSVNSVCQYCTAHLESWLALKRFRGRWLRA